MRWIVALLLLSGCVLKNYSDMDLVTKVDTCEEIDAEITKTQAYIKTLQDEGGWSWKDLVGTLIDLNIGNNVAWETKMSEANNRLKQLNDLKASKKCA